jgi:hypothetical protein
MQKSSACPNTSISPGENMGVSVSNQVSSQEGVSDLLAAAGETVEENTVEPESLYLSLIFFVLAN